MLICVLQLHSVQTFKQIKWLFIFCHKHISLVHYGACKCPRPIIAISCNFQNLRKHVLDLTGICATSDTLANDQVSCPNMAILTTDRYLRNRCPWSKNKLNFNLLRQKESMCGTFGTLATCQVSCPNLAILKIGPYLGNRCPQSKNKLNFDPLGQKEHICATTGTWATCQVS